MPPSNVMRRVIIAGSRQYHPEIADKLVADAMRDQPKPTLVLSGMATGIDRAGERWAARNGIEIERWPANWDKHGRAAGPLRNAFMAGRADALVLIWDGVSAGSRSMLREAQKRGLEVATFIFREDGVMVTR